MLKMTDSTGWKPEQLQYSCNEVSVG